MLLVLAAAALALRPSTPARRTMELDHPRACAQCLSHARPCKNSHGGCEMLGPTGDCPAWTCYCADADGRLKNCETPAHKAWRKGCAGQLDTLCAESLMTKDDCMQCFLKRQQELILAGCHANEVARLCQRGAMQMAKLLHLSF